VSTTMAPPEPAQAGAMTPAELNALRRRLIADRTLWSMQDIAAALDIKYQTILKWRRRANAEGGAGPRAFIAPEPTGEGGAPDRPRWRAGRVRKWAMQVGHMNFDGTPCRPKLPGQAPSGDD
jgi:hypothetical protein